MATETTQEVMQRIEAIRNRLQDLAEQHAKDFSRSFAFSGAAGVLSSGLAVAKGARHDETRIGALQGVSVGAVDTLGRYLVRRPEDRPLIESIVWELGSLFESAPVAQVA